MFKKIADFIASIGQSIQFVAFFAHFFCAAYVISRFYDWDLRILLALLVTIGAAIKEFWFDANYEKNPPQTFKDNLEDWLGWTLGALLGVIS